MGKTLTDAVQETLKAGGYYYGAIDGIFGAKTEQAVQAFQAEHFLESDGIIELFTWYALSKLETHASRCSLNAFRGY
ncbi:MAG: peptidoglycan-binding protein [Microcoleus sp. SIO2G3]|nr:peptidoglycan-binding protein [Microcoleus sp. SIO2G3]